jgi:hypothetical protein
VPLQQRGHVPRGVAGSKGFREPLSNAMRSVSTRRLASSAVSSIGELRRGVDDVDEDAVESDDDVTRKSYTLPVEGGE